MFLVSCSVAVVTQVPPLRVRQEVPMWLPSIPPQTINFSMVCRLRFSGRAGSWHWYPVEGTKTSTEVPTLLVPLSTQPPDIISPQYVRIKPQSNREESQLPSVSSKLWPKNLLWKSKYCMYKYICTLYDLRHHFDPFPNTNFEPSKMYKYMTSYTWDAIVNVALSVLSILPLTVCTTVGRGWTVTKSPPGLSSSSTALGTLGPVSPGTPASIHRTY